MSTWQAWELTPRIGVRAWLGAGFLRLSERAPGACFFVCDGEVVRVRGPRRLRHLRQRLACAGRLRDGRYEPEIERFGGPALIDASERFFVHNSWVVASASSRGPRMQVALELGALLLRQTCDGEALPRFCRETAIGWEHTLSAPWAAAMRRTAAVATPEVLQTVRAWWRLEKGRARGHRAVQLASGSAWAGAAKPVLQAARYAQVLRALWHMQNHRLGLRPAEECWLAHVLARASEVR